jgi:twitching motility protein PilT
MGAVSSCTRGLVRRDAPESSALWSRASEGQHLSSIQELLRHLARPEVLELALGTGRAPAVKMGGVYRAVGTVPLSSNEILELLKQAGAPDGQALAEKPLQWSTQAAGVGAVAVAAIKRGEEVQARFSATKGAPASAAAPVAAAPAPRAATPAPAVAARPAAAPGFNPMAPTGAVAPGAVSKAPAAPPSTAYVHTPEPAAQASVPAASEVSSAFSPSDRYESFEAMLDASRTRQASDLHVVAGRPALFRVAGELLPSGGNVTAEQVEKMVMPFIPKRLQAQLEKEGSCDFALQHPVSGRFRVNVSRQRTGLKACLRVIPKEVPTLESLGLPESIAHATHHHQGLIIITGPSGHGKTSTLAALVNLINTDSNHHIITVEDPVEYVHPLKKAMMSQREVGTHTKSFQSALKGSLREDPDVIVVGELRDTETVRMALSAGETGHLLIATMNTPNAAKTIDRLIDLFPPADQGQVRMSLSSGLRMIVSQRLVPTADRRGVVVAAEVLPGSVSLGNLIRDEKTYQIPSLQQRGKSMGIIRLDDSLAELVHSGKTTLEIAREYSESPDELPSMIKALSAPAPAATPDASAKKGADGMLGKMGSLMGRK